jgi:hypothetical protein
MAGMVEGMGQHRLLDLGGHAVGMRPLGTRQPVDEPFGSIGLEIAPDLVELLARIAHHLAGAGHIGKFAREIEQRQLATCYLILRGHVRCPRI